MDATTAAAPVADPAPAPAPAPALPTRPGCSGGLGAAGTGVAATACECAQRTQHERPDTRRCSPPGGRSRRAGTCAGRVDPGLLQRRGRLDLQLPASPLPSPLPRRPRLQPRRPPPVRGARPAELLVDTTATTPGYTTTAVNPRTGPGIGYIVRVLNTNTEVQLTGRLEDGLPASGRRGQPALDLDDLPVERSRRGRPGAGACPRAAPDTGWPDHAEHRRIEGS